VRIEVRDESSSTGIKSYGNDGSMESQEKQTALSLPSHTALESSQKPRASHIPTAPVGKKQKRIIMKNKRE
jgi:hypothetical protein